MSAANATTVRRSHPTPFRPRLAGSRLWCRACSCFDELEHLREEWDDFALAARGGITSTFDWNRIWWRHYGGAGEARIYLFHDEHGLAGAIPMMIERIRFGPVTLRIARLIGSACTQGVCSPPVRHGWAANIFNELLAKLIRDERCDAVCIGPLSHADANLTLARRACAARPELGRVLRDHVLTRHTTIRLPDSFDAYLRSLSKNQRFNFRKSWRRLQADHEAEVQLIDEPALLDTEFTAFVRMHQRQWSRQNMLGHFRDWPSAEAFNRDLVHEMSGQGRSCILQLRAGGAVVARQYGFQFGDTFHCRLAARSTERRWEPYSLGGTSLVRLFEALIARGVRQIDAGVGEYDYKLRLGGRQHEVSSLLFVARRATSRMRAQAMIAVADGLDLLYYRLWHCRLARHSPLPRRALWRSWITTRL